MKGKNVSTKAFANLDLEVTKDDLGDHNLEPELQDRFDHQATYVLWDEIVETSKAQARDVTYDPNLYPKDAELRDSIKKHGVKTPIIVYRLDKGGILTAQGDRKFKLQAGHRRMLAALDAGVKGAIAIVNPSDDDGDLTTLIENTGRRDLTDYEMAVALRSIMEARGITEIQEVIKITGLPKDSVYPSLRAYHAPKVLQERWVDGDISTRAVIELRPVWEKIDTSADSLVDSLSKLTLTEASSWRALIEAGSNPEEALNTAQMKKGLTSLHSLSQAGDVPGDSGDTSSSTTNTTKSTKKRGAAGKRRSTAQKKNIATTISVILNIPEEVAKGLFEEVVEAGIKDDGVIWAACLYIANGGNREQALDVATSTMSVSKLGRLVLDHVKLLQKLAAERERIGNDLILNFLHTAFPLAKTNGKGKQK